MIYWYYFVCAFYCIARSYKKWLTQDMGANTMELIMVLTIGWILAPIDFGIVWFKHFHTKKESMDLGKIDIEKEKHNIY